MSSLKIKNLIVNGECVNYTYKTPANSNVHSRTYDVLVAYDKEAIPNINPTKEELETWFENLDLNTNECSYCGENIKGNKHIDHLIASGSSQYKIVKNTYKQYIPCCSDCNHKKGNRNFIEWYTDPKTKEYIFKKGFISKETYNKRLEILGDICKNPDTYDIDEEYIEHGKLSKSVIKFLLSCAREDAEFRNNIMLNKNGINTNYEPNKNLLVFFNKIKDMIIKEYPQELESIQKEIAMNIYKKQIKKQESEIELF